MEEGQNEQAIAESNEFSHMNDHQYIKGTMNVDKLCVRINQSSYLCDWYMRLVSWESDIDTDT